MMTETFPLTRDAALERWRAFLPQVRSYGARRNFVSTTHADVSRLSPAIRFGLITPEEIVRQTLARHELRAVEKWGQEVCWRSYWKGWLEMRPQVWRSWRQRVNELRVSLPNDVLTRAQEVSEGRSGVAVMDHFASELRETGYLHNHARMWWASFWIHAERLPWELGAEFFFQHLLDADPASNTLSWRWVAGLQTAGKTYLVRRSNLERYCVASLLEDTTGLERIEDGRVTPVVLTDHADLTRQSLPEIPTTCPQLSGRMGIWIHADDLCLENSPFAVLRPASVAAFTSAETYARYGLSERRIQSIHTALRDGLTRAGTHFDCTTSLIDTPFTADGIKAWVEGEKLDAVIAMAPNIGPVADALPSIRRALDSMNVPLHLVRRPWDAQMFPAAKSGFFPFWEKTSRWLGQQFPPAQMTLL
jgi:deoxyribodipyrimidine photo-lyase